jgi:hypothetical protein
MRTVGWWPATAGIGFDAQVGHFAPGAGPAGPRDPRQPYRWRLNHCNTGNYGADGPIDTVRYREFVASVTTSGHD